MAKTKKTEDKKEVDSLNMTYADVMLQSSELATGLIKIAGGLPISVKANKDLIPLYNELKRQRADYAHQEELIQASVDADHPVPGKPAEPENKTKAAMEKYEKQKKTHLAKMAKNAVALQGKIKELNGQKIDFKVERVTISVKDLDLAVDRDIKRAEMMMKEKPDILVRAIEFTTAELIALDPIIELKD